MLNEGPGQPRSIRQVLALQKPLFRHWETWVGVVLCGASAALGAYVGLMYFKRSVLPLLLGGGLGGYLYSRVTRYVARRYGLAWPEMAPRPFQRALEFYFRDAPQGRVFALDGPRSTHGYLLRSPEQERMIRSYVRLKLFAQYAVMVLGLIALYCIVDFRARWNAAETPRDLILLGVLLLAAFGTLLVLPLLWLQRLARGIETDALRSEDRIALTPEPMPRGAWAIVAGLLALALALILGGTLFLSSTGR
jgi:hypothetical protein